MKTTEVSLFGKRVTVNLSYFHWVTWLAQATPKQVDIEFTLYGNKGQAALEYWENLELSK